MTLKEVRFRPLIAVFFALTITALWAPSGFAQSTPPRSVEILATQAWAGSGITVRAGDSITVAVQGEAAFGLRRLASMPPSGVPWGAECEAIAERAGAWTAPGLPCWSAVARVGEGKPVAIGSRATFEAPADGKLQFGANDNYFDDNSGSWTASVTVTPAGTSSGAASEGSDGDSSSSSVLPLLLAALGAVVLIGLIIVVIRRRSRPDGADETREPVAGVPRRPVTDASVEVNIFEVRIVDGVALRVGYNYFPEATVVHWRIIQNEIETAAGEFAAEGGGSTYHYVTLPFESALELGSAGAEVRFGWTIGDVPFEYSVLEQRTG